MAGIGVEIILRPNFFIQFNVVWQFIYFWHYKEQLNCVFRALILAVFGFVFQVGILLSSVRHGYLLASALIFFWLNSFVPRKCRPHKAVLKPGFFGCCFLPYFLLVLGADFDTSFRVSSSASLFADLKVAVGAVRLTDSGVSFILKKRKGGNLVMTIDIKELVMVLKSLAEEKSIEEDLIHSIIEQALAAAWRRDYGERDQNVRANLNLRQGSVDIYVIYDVVEEVEDPSMQISLKDARVKQADIETGQTIEEHHNIKDLGRVAAQTAKQVILQKLRETEKEMVLAEYEGKIGSIMTAIVTKVDPKVVRCEISRVRAIMPLSEQIPNEEYRVGERIRVLLKEIDRFGREPQLILNRGGADFLRLLFEKEVPEMENGAVEIKAIVREPGVRSKVAVTSSVPNVDPVGTLIGGRGTRVQAVNGEVGEQEKIDIITWDADPKQYITNALSSNEIISVSILSPPTENEVGQAKVVVPKDRLSVAIGRSGQNVRLAGRLTGYDIDIIDDAQAAPKVTPHKLQRKEQLEESLLKAVKETQTDDSDTDENQTSD